MALALSPWCTAATAAPRGNRPGGAQAAASTSSLRARTDLLFDQAVGRAWSTDATLTPAFTVSKRWRLRLRKQRRTKTTPPKHKINGATHNTQRTRTRNAQHATQHDCDDGTFWRVALKPVQVSSSSTSAGPDNRRPTRAWWTTPRSTSSPTSKCFGRSS